MGYTGLAVINDGEPAYDITVSSVAINGGGRLEFHGRHTERLTKTDGEAFYPAFVEMRLGGIFGNGLFDFMRERGVVQLRVPILYRDSDDNWFRTDVILERDVSKPGGLRLSWTQKTISNPRAAAQGDVDIQPANVLSGDDPQVVIETAEDRLPWLAREKFPKERPIYLQNWGRSPAYKVQIATVRLEHTEAIAIFPEIAVLPPRMRIPVRPTLEFKPREEMSGVSEFEILLQTEWPCVAGYDGELTVPMRITYEDSSKRNFRTDLKFGYSFSRGSRAFDFEFTRLRAWGESEA